MPPTKSSRPHLFLSDAFTEATLYQTPNSGPRNKPIPRRARAVHAAALRGDLNAISIHFDAVKPELESAGWEDGFGISVRFTSFPDVHLEIDSLEQKNHGIELLSVRVIGTETIAAVWIPEGKLAVFEQKIADYVAVKRDKNQSPIDNQKLVDAIREIRAAVIDDLWTDGRPMPPENKVGRFEAWISTPPTENLSVRRGRANAGTSKRVERFRQIALSEGIDVSRSALVFPEHSILQLQCTTAQLRESAHLLGQLAELRYAPETPEFFMHLAAEDQREWSEELLQRVGFAGASDLTPYICLLDTGCTQGHPLIAPALDPSDLHTVNPVWNVDDKQGHGTEQAGLAIWGDLSNPLASQSQSTIEHRLESVKLLPYDGGNANEHLGYLTAQAVSLPEIRAPFRRRLFSMALTSTASTAGGRPTAWSAEIDAITSDWAGNGESPRLMFISAGNVTGLKPGDYPLANSLTPVEDPAQAWNAVAVGAITHKDKVLGNNSQAFSLLATLGQLSPYSRTSDLWRHESPIKPDVVFEGGNQADDGTLVSTFDSLSLLTTNYEPIKRHYSTSFATSAATALASRFAAQVIARYPENWPETTRALMVHSADWTPGLLGQLPGTRPDSVVARLRSCGWGEPDLARALHSGSDSLTLIVQSSLQPFRRKARVKGEDGVIRGGYTAACDMHLHRLPWPQSTLQSMLFLRVELRVTLSYFIEPNPGERGNSGRFNYASHGLRFAVQKPAETSVQFLQRINKLARDDESEFFGGGDPDWMLGFRKRFRGSIHHDRLNCSAVDLASRDHIAVFPVGGWWKTREAQNRLNRQARYALVVSIRTPDLPNTVDLYTEVEHAIKLATPTPTEVQV